jgi:hypothetical protein
MTATVLGSGSRTTREKKLKLAVWQIQNKKCWLFIIIVKIIKINSENKESFQPAEMLVYLLSSNMCILFFGNTFFIIFIIIQT